MRRQREVYPACLAGRNESVGGVERGLGFADAHRRFEDIDAGATGRFDQAALDWVRLKGKNLPERKPRREARRRESGGIDGTGDALHCRVVEGRAGADPVRHGGQPGQHSGVQRIADFREPFARRLHEQRQKPRPLMLPRRAAELLSVGWSSAELWRVAVVASGNLRDEFARFQRVERALTHASMAAPLAFERRICAAQYGENCGIGVFNRRVDFLLEGWADFAEVVAGGDERRAVGEERLAQVFGRAGDQFPRNLARDAAMIEHRSSGDGAAGIDFPRFGEAAFKWQQRTLNRSLRIFQGFGVTRHERSGCEV